MKLLHWQLEQLEKVTAVDRQNWSHKLSGNFRERDLGFAEWESPRL